jgi:hypothetical protein
MLNIKLSHLLSAWYLKDHYFYSTGANVKGSAGMQPIG